MTNQVRSEASPDLCVDARFKESGERFGLEKCLSDNPDGGGEQVRPLLDCLRRISEFLLMILSAELNLGL